MIRDTVKLLAVIVLLGFHAGVQAAENDLLRELSQELDKFPEAWKQRDVAASLEIYHPDAVYMTATGRAGVEEMAASYEELFDKFANTTIKNTNLEVKPLGDKYALLTGRYVITKVDGSELAGWFTLVWEKTAQGWKIIHDQAEEEPAEEP